MQSMVHGAKAMTGSGGEARVLKMVGHTRFHERCCLEFAGWQLCIWTQIRMVRLMRLLKLARMMKMGQILSACVVIIIIIIDVVALLISSISNNRTRLEDG